MELNTKLSRIEQSFMNMTSQVKSLRRQQEGQRRWNATEEETPLCDEREALLHIINLSKEVMEIIGEDLALIERKSQLSKSTKGPKVTRKRNTTATFSLSSSDIEDEDITVSDDSSEWDTSSWPSFHQDGASRKSTMTRNSRRSLRRSSIHSRRDKRSSRNSTRVSYQTISDDETSTMSLKSLQYISSTIKALPREIEFVDEEDKAGAIPRSRKNEILEIESLSSNNFFGRHVRSGSSHSRSRSRRNMQVIAESPSICSRKQKA